MVGAAFQRLVRCGLDCLNGPKHVCRSAINERAVTDFQSHQLLWYLSYSILLGDLGLVFYWLTWGWCFTG